MNEQLKTAETYNPVIIVIDRKTTINVDFVKFAKTAFLVYCVAAGIATAIKTTIEIKKAKKEEESKGE